METIFHEKQEGSLCAQHCLNALLQGEYFNAVDLGTLAQQIDEEERSRMAEGGVHSEDYRKFIQQPSGNVDDSGYFSVQVIASALKVWGLELVPYNSQDPIAQSAQRDPTKHKAYICNYRDHWLTIRKIGYQWFNLNSLLTGPELLSDTYLALFLAQLQQEGYSIFIVIGILPECVPDKALRDRPATQLEKPRLLSEVRSRQDTSSALRSHSSEDDDATLRETLKLSLESSRLSEDAQLQAALSMSLTDFENGADKRQGSTTVHDVASANDLHTNRTEDNHISSESGSSIMHTDTMSEQEMLEAALKMSMEAS